MPQAAPPASVEDYDTDRGSPVPGTLRRAQSGRRNQKLVVGRSKSKAPAPASDSGYSSHASAPQATTQSPVQPRVLDPSARAAVQPPPVVASPTKSSRPKPKIHRIDSGQGTKAQTVASPAPHDSRRCPDPNCNDPNCSSANPERRYTLPQHERQQKPVRPQPQHYSTYTTTPTTPTYSQAPYPPQYNQAPPMQPPPLNTMAPPPVPRQRSGSISRARPVSIHGYNTMSYNGGAPPGPPPSASAYYAYSPAGYQPQTNAYAGAMAPANMDYPPPSPVVPPSPSSPSMNTYGGYPGFTPQYSARTANPNVPGLEPPRSIPQPGLSLQRTVSARRPSERPSGRRSSYIQEAEPYSESATESDSEVDAEYEHRPQRRHSRRESRTPVETVVATRRPATSKKYVSEPVVPRATRRDSREVTRVRTTPDDYLSSSDIGDSDRTARAVIDRPNGRDSERGSRRPSVSSKGSSTRTKPSSLSSVTDYSRVIIEGPNGRRTAYLSNEQQADLIRQYQQQKLEDRLEEQRIRQEKIDAFQQQEIEAYQKMTSGQPRELTAENIKRNSDRKTTGTSRISGRSQKSSNSSSKMADGIKIETGGTVLHVYGDTKIEVRGGEDGGPAQFIIGSSTGKESSYVGTSKSSSNGRLGRSRRRNQIPEDPYESGH